MLHLLRYEPDAEDALHRLLTTPRLSTLAERVEIELRAIASDPGSAAPRDAQANCGFPSAATPSGGRASGSGEARVVLWTLPEDAGGPLILGIFDPDALV